MNIPSIVEAQKAFFKSHKTKDISFRIALLKQLKFEILSREQDIYDALKKDFNKSEFESYISEIGIVLSEIDLVLNNLRKWAKPKRIRPSMLTFPSTDYIYKEPYGTILILAPWNYPFQLAIAPLIAAIASGNTVVVKPSELTLNTSKLVTDIVDTVFNKEHAVSIQGGVPVAAELLDQNWDFIFFTGSVTIGKIVAQAAAKYLTPVTLELGGKSPCIIDDTNNIKLVAKRLVWGKFLNAGQTCISPDYLIVKSTIKTELIKHLKIEITKAYGKNPQESPDFPRIINKKKLIRLSSMLNDVKVVFGGHFDEEDCYLSPTLIDDPNLDSEVMQDEIFGPILPIISYDSNEDIARTINNYEKPLSLYVFSKRRSFINDVLKRFSFGGGAINDTLVHFGNQRLPFGGVGTSGMGAYHGKHGFDTFSHKKSIVKRGNWIDIPIRYAPYSGKLKYLKTMFKWFS